MKNLIIADIRRILMKKTFWMFLLIDIIVLLGNIIYLKVDGNWNAFSFTSLILTHLENFAVILVSINVFLIVYADEFRSMSMTVAIGRGISRDKIIISKVIDTVMMTFVCYLVIALVVFVSAFAANAGLSPTNINYILTGLFTSAYIAMGVVVISAVVLFISNNVALSIFFELILTMVLPLVIILLKDVPLIATLHIDRYYLFGVANWAFSDWMLGLVGNAIMVFFLGFVCYVGLATLATIFVFRRKELEF